METPQRERWQTETFSIEKVEEGGSFRAKSAANASHQRESFVLPFTFVPATKMGHKKLIRFNAINDFANVLQKPEGMAGKWAEYFDNQHPITLELACGKGEYSVNLGRENKDNNYIGVDIKGNRLFRGAKTALQEGLNNVAFLRTHIQELSSYFAAGEVNEIWIVFPDPFLRESKAKNRLTHSRYLKIYQSILKPGGIIRLKTDSRELYDFTQEMIALHNCEIVEDLQDIHANGKATGALAIQTYYESLHLADERLIYYLAFTLPEAAIDVPKRKRKLSADAGE